ncbi:hypothetical protein [Brevundimonas sp.]|uniref:hypothetical protein n=1 Tax=Brevundimonas sp. TaxID=1871086 RepID=UPI0028A2006A|nr:hypothetical protein [Brevundimonas sp.]
MAKVDQIAQKIADRLGSMSEEERVHHNASQIAESERQHAHFKAAFDQGCCYICEADLTTFVETAPCLHWFLRPPGVKKRHYPAVAEKFGMMAIQSWVRWVANEDGWARNIADTTDEHHIVQVTARYGDYAWSISCGKTDFAGHTGKNSNFPHYHLQMSIKDRPFISYNDFHFRIHDDELSILKAMEATGVKSKFVNGESFDDVLATIDPQWVVDLPVDRTADPQRAAFNLQTILIADEGTTISGEAIYDMFQQAKRDGVSFASRAQTIPHSSGRTLIGEGPGVVDPAPREGGRGSNRRQG